MEPKKSEPTENPNSLPRYEPPKIAVLSEEGILAELGDANATNLYDPFSPLSP